MARKYKVEGIRILDDGTVVKLCTPQRTPLRQHIQRSVFNTRCFNNQAKRQMALQQAAKLSGRED